MNQALFDVIVLSLGKSTTWGHEKHQMMKEGVVKDYAGTFKGDDLWVSQAMEALEKILEKFPPDESGSNYDAAEQYRKTLNDRMRQRTWLSNVFGGTLFMPSHPNPTNRVALAERNVLQCFVMIKAREIGRLNRILRDLGQDT